MFVVCKDVVGSLCASDYKGIRNQDIDEGKWVVMEEPICLETFHCTTETNRSQPLKARDYKDPLCVTDDEPLMIEMTSTKNTIVDDGVSPTLTARMGTGGNQVNSLLEPRYKKTVRRLTPMECERLQGFPDHWTDIGEWTDTKGKKHQTADSARYKALGNSIALPFWFWLTKNMSKHLPEDAKLGSLFSGIGGFDICWEKVFGVGTSRWCSEIEEFQIAVLKKHFGDEATGEEGDVWKYLLEFQGMKGNT